MNQLWVIVQQPIPFIGRGYLSALFFLVLALFYIFNRYLSAPDIESKTAIFATFKTLTASQRKTGQYFVVVALVFLMQIGVGAILAHYYTERSGFYGIPINNFLPFNFLRDIHIQTPIV